MGLGDTGKKVVYLCSGSASLQGVYGQIKLNLKDSIKALDNAQQFNVIFSVDGSVMQLFRNGTQPATDENKKKAVGFIENVAPTGDLLPMLSIKIAMHEKPDSIFLLTDGFDKTTDFDDRASALHPKDSDGKLKINCVYLQSDADEKTEAALKKIAEDSHGKYKKILKADM